MNVAQAPESTKVRSALLHIKTMLRREKKIPIKNYVLPFACVGPISEEEKTALADKIRSMGYSVEIESSIFSATSHMRIDWTDRNTSRTDSISNFS